MGNEMKSPEELFERINSLEQELNSVKSLIEIVINGGPYNELLEYVAFESVKKDAQVASSKLARMMEHLFKLKYSSSVDSYDDSWRNEIERFRNDVIDATLWNYRKPDKNMIKCIIDDLNETYLAAINNYVKAANKYDDLKPGIHKIPDTCPWSFTDLMDGDIHDLLQKLPR